MKVEGARAAPSPASDAAQSAIAHREEVCYRLLDRRFARLICEGKSSFP